MSDPIDASLRSVALSIIQRLLPERGSWPTRLVTDRYYNPSQRVHLSGRPVRDVLSAIDQDGHEVPYLLSADGVLILNPEPFPTNYGWAGCRRVLQYVDVEYGYGLTDLPVDVAHAVDILTAELVKANSGDAGCRLPKRVTSVSRQGVSWTLLDPQDFLEQGRTGIYEIDLILSSRSRGRKQVARARVLSPEFRPPVRLASQVVDPHEVPIRTLG